MEPNWGNFSSWSPGLKMHKNIFWSNILIYHLFFLQISSSATTSRGAIDKKYFNHKKLEVLPLSDQNKQEYCSHETHTSPESKNSSCVNTIVNQWKKKTQLNAETKLRNNSPSIAIISLIGHSLSSCLILVLTDTFSLTSISCSCVDTGAELVLVWSTLLSDFLAACDDDDNSINDKRRELMIMVSAGLTYWPRTCSTVLGLNCSVSSVLSDLPALSCSYSHPLPTSTWHFSYLIMKLIKLSMNAIIKSIEIRY